VFRSEEQRLKRTSPLKKTISAQKPWHGSPTNQSDHKIAKWYKKRSATTMPQPSNTKFSLTDLHHNLKNRKKEIKIPGAHSRAKRGLSLSKLGEQ
jgi:hypothetical protein